jgi:hypothetical protein
VWSIPSPPWLRRAKQPVVRRSRNQETSARLVRCRAEDRVRGRRRRDGRAPACTARPAQPLATVLDRRMRLGGNRPGSHPATGLAQLDEAAAKLRRRPRRSRARSSGRRQPEEGLCRTCCSMPPVVVARPRDAGIPRPAGRRATKASATRQVRRPSRRSSALTRTAGDGPHGRRLRGLVVVLWPRGATHPRGDRAHRL